MRIKASQMLGSVLKRVMCPQHLWRVIKLQRGKKRMERVYNDPQLKLYSQILPGGFLHYGYFDDPNTQPQDISLNDIHLAQLRYAELILENIVDRESPVLDVGCGMGGLIKLMLDQGLNPVALSPDRNQIRYVKSRYAQVPMIEARFEDIPCEEHVNRYGTIITAESLNYLNLDAALPLIEKLLKPGGRWIACDIFCIGEARRRSAHWNDFEKCSLQSSLRFVHQQDITANVLPTISYLYMLGHDIARPVLNFTVEKLQTKQPGVHYMFEKVIEMINEKAALQLEILNPDTFAATKRYMLVVMEKNT
jgi:cyclopropane fatty-acyl-phospholipid synthase-like methyltransferase